MIVPLWPHSGELWRLTKISLLSDEEVDLIAWSQKRLLSQSRVDQ